MVYGGRLAPGCCDLEGLWEDWRPPEGSAGQPLRLPAPVPGVTTRTGDLWYQKQALLPAGGRARLLLGGVDDEDVTTVDGVEVGRTPLDRAAKSWETPRRYDFDARSGALRRIQVRVTNADGSGGIWRGPCVLGPAEALAHGDGWTRAACEGRALFHWCPDAYRHALEGRFTVSLTSCDRTREWVPDNVTSGGRFLIPPYVVAFQGANGWWGIGTLDLARAEDGLRLEWRDGGFTCPFLIATRPTDATGGWSAGPRVALLTASSREAVLRAYLNAIPRPAPPARRPAWWSGPQYCSWGDQCYGGREGGQLNAGNLAHWLGALAQARIEAPLVTLDAGWWGLPKETTARLHAEGRHALVWTQPHWAPVDSPDFRAHPEWLVHDAAGGLWRFDDHNWLIDYSAAGARAHMAKTFASYLTDFGADGVKLDFNYTAAPVWSVPADSAWGAGEEYRARVLQEVYRDIKRARPDALVTASCANPLFGRVQDMVRLNDDWSGDPQTLRRRAAIVLAAGEWVDSDDWNAYESSLAAQAVERPVWGCFTLCSALFRGDARNRPAPLSPAWRARLSAITHLAALAPVRAGQRCRYDPERGLARREGPDGSLAAGAFPLEGTPQPLQVLAVASGRSLLVTAVASGTVVIPLPRRPTSIKAVGHDGSRRPVPWSYKEGKLALAVEDASGKTAWYEAAGR